MPKPAPNGIKKVPLDVNEVEWILEGLKTLRESHAAMKAWGCVDALFDIINKFEDLKEAYTEAN